MLLKATVWMASLVLLAAPGVAATLHPLFRCSTSQASTGCPNPAPGESADFRGDNLILTDAQYVAPTPLSPSANTPQSPSTASSIKSGRQPPLRCARIGGCEGSLAWGGSPAPAAAPITISDLASFTPAVGELIVQPTSWGIVGVPTNFVATATEHVQAGTLLDQPVQVRWRPVAFTFDYGDGTTVTTSSPGTAWRGSGDDWTSTATSHAYAARGQFTASLTVAFEADVASGSAWTTVPGRLTVAAATEPVRIFQAQTVLTRGDCLQHPGDAGCAP